MSLISAPRIKAVIQSEASGTRSRENAVVTQAGSVLASGTVVGKLASGKYVPYDNAGSGGAEVAAGVLYNWLPAKTGDAKAVVFVRDCEVHRAALVGLDTPGEADLKALGIIVRDAAGLAGIATPTLV